MRKLQKCKNDLDDLDFDLVSSRSHGHVDLVYTYLPYKYDHDQRSLRQSNVYFSVWPCTDNIWPWGQKFKIPPPKPLRGSPKEHFYSRLTSLHLKLREEFAKTCENGKKRKRPWWPWLWPCDLEVMGVSWPCPYLPTMRIWSWSEVIKAVKCLFQSLTLEGQYLTLRAKIQNSAA